MSFRSRLTSFFILIVVVPLAAIAVLAFSLIGAGQTGKAQARVAGIASTAESLYAHASAQASSDATRIADQLAVVSTRRLKVQAAALVTTPDVARVIVTVGSTRLVDVGKPGAIAPGFVVIKASGGHPEWTLGLSELTAPQLASELAGTDTQVVIREGSTALAATLPAAADLALPRTHGSITIGPDSYEVETRSFAGFAGAAVTVSILSNLAATGRSDMTTRLEIAIFLGAFLLLAFAFAMFSSRALQSQLARFLDAARRLGSGDFSATIPVSGRDEFALLGDEFNNMSRQLARRLNQLEQERSRVRKAIRRIGEAFASGLDREALLELALKTAMDATDADRGRVSARETTVDPLTETVRVGRLAGLEDPIHEAERRALVGEGVGEASVEDLYLATVALGAIVPGGPAHGLITVCRADRPFTEDDLELLRSLAARATLALANVHLHYDIQRQAVTDDLTGLATHGHFQELLSAVMEEVRRYRYPVGLIMLDIDDFKSVNDVYGHQQGDLVLRYVADALRETSRDVDVAARYGGEEMALILPHTDLEGTFEMAERARSAIESLAVPLLDGQGTLQITASVGAAASTDGNKNELIATADAALYVAKREGKNRTVRGTPNTANVVGGE